MTTFAKICDQCLERAGDAEVYTVGILGTRVCDACGTEGDNGGKSWNMVLSEVLRRLTFRKTQTLLDDETTDWSRLYVNRDKTWGFRD